MTLMRWEGPASESIPELAYNQADPDKAINPKYAYDYDVAHISDVDWINTSDRNAVKQAIMEYGSGFFGYCWMQAYNSTNRSGAYCYIQSNYTYGANHAVTLVGWDDNYSKENFQLSARQFPSPERRRLDRQELLGRRRNLRRLHRQRLQLHLL